MNPHTTILAILGIAPFVIVGLSLGRSVIVLAIQDARARRRADLLAELALADAPLLDAVDQGQGEAAGSGVMRTNTGALGKFHGNSLPWPSRCTHPETSAKFPLKGSGNAE